MKIFLTLFLITLTFIISDITKSQAVTEKELFTLTYKGTADAYNLKYDRASGNYCYMYHIPDENKSFIISKDGVSDKYDYISPADIRFDSKGNYYAITSDYKPDYGINNYFAIANGKVIKSYEYIESYNCYVNRNNEFVFIFKEKDLYMIGFYNPETGFREKGPFDNVRVAFVYRESTGQMEGDVIEYEEDDFFHNEKGERAFVANVNGKTKIMFETSEIETNYTDINESSLTKNKNNELSFIAKTGGRFYQYSGNEFVVSGNKEYEKFDIVNLPVQFNESNEPVYIAGDSVMDYRYRYYPVIGNQVQRAYADKSKSGNALEFESYVADLKLSNDGSISYFGNTAIVIPADNSKPDSYEQYFFRSFIVKDGIANELGISVNRIKYNDKGDMLYSGIADLNKKEVLLMMNYGESKIIINKKKFDDIYEYGFTPDNEIYYVGQNYEDPERNQKYGAFLYIGDKLIGTSNYFAYQNEGDQSAVLIFDSKNNYAFVTEVNIDSANSKYVVNTNKGPLPFPENVTGGDKFYYVSDLNYSRSDKLFFIGDTNLEQETYVSTRELFYDNKSLKKSYNSVYNLVFDKEKDQITFLGSRENKVYFVTVSL